MQVEALTVVDELFYMIGQLLSIVAVILGFISYQMKTSRGILFFQIATALVFAVHYLLIDAFSAVVLNLLSAVACIFYYFRDKRGNKGLAIPVIFITLTVVMGLATWEGFHSVLIITGLAAGSMGLCLQDAQKARISILIKSPLCLLYNVIVISSGGMIYESVTLISSILGIIKYRNGKEKSAVERG